MLKEVAIIVISVIFHIVIDPASQNIFEFKPLLCHPEYLSSLLVSCSRLVYSDTCLAC